MMVHSASQTGAVYVHLSYATSKIKTLSKQAQR